MTVTVTLAQILHLAPSARSSYRDAFQNGQAVFDRYGISGTKLRVAHFVAQMMHECGGLAIQFENLNYSAARLPKVWPKRFQPTGPLDPSAYANNPQKLGNEVYGGRMGNSGPEDGYTYRGRGLLQITGKESYMNATTALRKNNSAAPDFVINPDAVISADWCLVIAAFLWFSKGCNELADQDNIKKVTYAINGGQIGLAGRTDWVRRTKAVWL